MGETDCIDVDRKALIEAFNRTTYIDLIKQAEKIDKGLKYLESIGIDTTQDRHLRQFKDLSLVMQKTIDQRFKHFKNLIPGDIIQINCRRLAAYYLVERANVDGDNTRKLVKDMTTGEDIKLTWTNPDEWITIFNLEDITSDDR